MIPTAPLATVPKWQYDALRDSTRMWLSHAQTLIELHRAGVKLDQTIIEEIEGVLAFAYDHTNPVGERHSGHRPSPPIDFQLWADCTDATVDEARRAYAASISDETRPDRMEDVA